MGLAGGLLPRAANHAPAVVGHRGRYWLQFFNIQRPWAYDGSTTD